jgi:hypothetical protein
MLPVQVGALLEQAGLEMHLPGFDRRVNRIHGFPFEIMIRLVLLFKKKLPSSAL